MHNGRHNPGRKPLCAGSRRPWLLSVTGFAVGLRPWLGEFTAADWPCGTRGQGPDGPSDVDRFVDRVAG